MSGAAHTMATLWGGRFEQVSDDTLFRQFNDSLPFDYRLAEQDIQASMAWATALKNAGVLTQEELSRLHGALRQLLRVVHDNPAEMLGSGAEDIHSWVESELVKRIGDLGKKLHTGRSRNDQVATDLRLWVENAVVLLLSELRIAQRGLIALAEQHVDTIFPGYTHLQRAQPVRFAHWCMAYVEMFDRDVERLEDVIEHMDQCPLGSGALAGTAYPINRHQLARSLGFAGPTRNSLDAVSDRDYVIELLSSLALVMTHLSRFAEDLIFYSSGEAGFVTLGDDVSTGSSLMPQKKNPDALELIRGKCGRVYGALVGMLTTMKALPLAYNKDMQEDKEALFNAVDTVSVCLQVTEKVLLGLKVNAETAKQAAQRGYSNATELADYLVRKNIPFREAHHIAGRAVLHASAQQKPLEALTLDELQVFHPLIGSDVYTALSLESCLEQRNVFGAVAKAQVVEAIASAKKRVNGQPDSDELIVSDATVHDVPAIVALINHWAKEGENLPRSRADIVSHVQDFIVAKKDGIVVGCAALYIYNEEIAEIRSLGVWPQFQGLGQGKAMVDYLCERARQLGLRKVLSLTRVPKFFAKLGFVVDQRDNLPDKVLKDCQFCPKLNACDETAMIWYPEQAA